MPGRRIGTSLAEWARDRLCPLLGRKSVGDQFSDVVMVVVMMAVVVMMMV
ncbi:MAG: hypothetical protein ABSC62_15230 [Terracidiphilus sp.]|jgi:hypothetical protein